MIQFVMHPVLGYVAFNEPIKTMPDDFKEVGAYAVPARPTDTSLWSVKNKAWYEPVEESV